MAYCTKCGKQNPDTAKFCTGCGTTLPASQDFSSQQFQPTEEPARKTRNTNWFAVGVFILVVLLGGSYFLFFHKPEKDKSTESGYTKVSDADELKIKDLVNKWNTRLNNRNSNDIADLYADELVFYHIQMGKGIATSMLNDFFKKNVSYRQEITGAVTVEKKENEIKCNFQKTVTLNGKPTDYPSYLRFSSENGAWKIVEEGDKITDYNLGKKQAIIPSYGIPGDFDGDGTTEYAWTVPPKIDETGESCAGECFALLTFSNTSIPSLRFDMSIGADVLQNIGNVDDNPGDELAIVPSWFTSCWRTGQGITFRNGLWKSIVEPFSIHCDLIEKGVKLIKKDPDKRGYVIVSYSDMEKWANDLNPDAMFQTKTVSLKK
ncbi:MAG TPA: zinc-ribbon domain-containing protein [Chitinophagaceae bacterium]|nr:zinc-ribbon domain-containing protein [Chitinophagaceae bacterium]